MRYRILSLDKSETLDLGALGERVAKIEYDYYPNESPVYYGPNPYPGSVHYVEINAVNIELFPKAIINIVDQLTIDALDALQSICLSHGYKMYTAMNERRNFREL